MPSITSAGPNDIMTAPGPPGCTAPSSLNHHNTAASPAPEISPDQNAEQARGSAICVDIGDLFRLMLKDDNPRINPTSAPNHTASQNFVPPQLAVARSNQPLKLANGQPKKGPSGRANNRLTPSENSVKAITVLRIGCVTSDRAWRSARAPGPGQRLSRIWTTVPYVQRNPSHAMTNVPRNIARSPVSHRMKGST